jgi:glycosyltransferase involved in cell wall biosynthesis
MKTEVSVVLPVYNEEAVVADTLSRVKNAMKRSGKGFEIIAVNDCSKDNSGKIIERVSGVKAIHHKVNKGYGASLLTGVKAAKGEWIAISDVDGTYPVEDIPKLLSYSAGFDMVVGARTKGAKEPLLRKPAKLFLCALTSALTKKWVPDVNSGLRVFRKKDALRFIHLYPQRFSFTTTMTIAFLVNKYRIKYVPINYYTRKGKSYIKPKDFFRFIILIFKVFAVAKKAKYNKKIKLEKWSYQRQ